MRFFRKLFPRKIPLRPDPAYREARLRQLSPERRKRYQAMVEELWG